MYVTPEEVYIVDVLLGKTQFCFAITPFSLNTTISLFENITFRIYLIQILKFGLSSNAYHEKTKKG